MLWVLVCLKCTCEMPYLLLLQDHWHHPLFYPCSSLLYHAAAWSKTLVYKTDIFIKTLRDEYFLQHQFTIFNYHAAAWSKTLLYKTDILIKNLQDGYLLYHHNSQNGLFYCRVTHKEWDFRDDCAEFTLSGFSFFKSLQL